MCMKFSKNNVFCRVKIFTFRIQHSLVLSISTFQQIWDQRCSATQLFLFFNSILKPLYLHNIKITTMQLSNPFVLTHRFDLNEIESLQKITNVEPNMSGLRLRDGFRGMRMQTSRWLTLGPIALTQIILVA